MDRLGELAFPTVMGGCAPFAVTLFLSHLGDFLEERKMRGFFSGAFALSHAAQASVSKNKHHCTELARRCGRVVANYNGII